MFVSDLHHFLDLPDDIPGPARRMAEHLGGIVRAGTAGDVGPAWESALPCPRRPGHRPCPGRMIVQRADPLAPIQWACSVCNDQGVISNWQDTPFDLRSRELAAAEPGTQIVITAGVAGALRDLPLLDLASQRRVFGIRGRGDACVLTTTVEELTGLTGRIAAEAKHEPNQRRRHRFEAAMNALNGAAEGMGPP
jgi:hypothetical protein